MKFPIHFVMSTGIVMVEVVLMQPHCSIGAAPDICIHVCICVHVCVFFLHKIFIKNGTAFYFRSRFFALNK